MEWNTLGTLLSDMDSSSIGGLLLVVLLIAGAMAGLVFHFSRAGTLLDRWAASNGFVILEREWRPLVRGPFFFTTSKGQEVYRVVVRDRVGTIRKGYVRCGGFLLGMLSDNVEVRWDAEPLHRPGFPVILPNDRPPDE